jgi:hypothetical protein
MYRRLQLRKMAGRIWISGDVCRMEGQLAPTFFKVSLLRLFGEKDGSVSAPTSL